MAHNLHLGYDLFASIMEARDKQALNMAWAILNEGENIHFTSDSYKPHVSYTEGSFSLLVQYFIKERGGNIVEAKDADVIVVVHETDEVPEDFKGIIFDPWRNHTGDNVIRYGDTR